MNYEEIITQLVTIRDQFPLTSIQRIALNYAISAVKTLDDMFMDRKEIKE